LSKKTIHRRIADGSLPSALFGRSRLIRKRDLLELTCAT
jgi:excisionase family DNA binding protein